MAVWSTYTPVGISLGLILSAHFAGTTGWRSGYLVHLILFALLVLAGWWLPRSPVVVHAAQARPGLLSALTQAGPVRLSLTFSALLMMGFGMSTVFPDWFAVQHQVSVGTAATILGIANLAMIPGGFFTGWWLARGRRDISLLVVLMLLAVTVSLPLFMPGHSQSLRIVAMVVWLVAQGAAIAVVTAALARVVGHPAQGAAAAGLLSQIAAITTFVTPLVWRPILAGGSWMQFLVVVGLSAASALALFPRRGAAAF
jgi:predicted MFS family arabinose efflux permease